MVGWCGPLRPTTSPSGAFLLPSARAAPPFPHGLCVLSAGSWAPAFRRSASPEGARRRAGPPAAVHRLAEHQLGWRRPLRSPSPTLSAALPRSPLTHVNEGLISTGFPNRKPEKMIDIKAWAEYVVEWAAKDPYGFLTTVILALTPLFIVSAALSWKLAKMIEAREREQKKKQKRQENIAKAKRTKKD
ncbi:small integral membrane protein 15 isoform 1-T1 [Amazona ochrocephala]